MAGLLVGVGRYHHPPLTWDRAGGSVTLIALAACMFGVIIGPGLSCLLAVAAVTTLYAGIGLLTMEPMTGLYGGIGLSAIGGFMVCLPPFMADPLVSSGTANFASLLTRRFSPEGGSLIMKRMFKIGWLVLIIGLAPHGWLLESW